MPRVATTLAFRGTGLKMVWGSSTHGGRQQKGVRCTHGGYHEIQQISGLPTLLKVTHMRVLPLLVLLGFTGCSHTSPYLASKDPVPGGIPSLAPDYRLLLLGDAGDPRKGPVLPLLSDWASQFPRRSTVVFLGDNMYPEGITPERAHQADAILGPQVDAVTGSGADGVFVPGNHDWAYARSGDIGLHAVRRQADYINERLGDGSFLPEGGKPGPVVRDLPAENPSVRLVVLDTQWWLHSASKPAANEATVLEELEKAVATELPVVIVAHHPLVSVGVHGGHFSWQDHLFPLTRLRRGFWLPLPVFGTLYTLLRAHGLPSVQDLQNQVNRHMVGSLSSAMSTGHVLAYAAGHEHNLQVLTADPAAQYMLVSGASVRERLTPTWHRGETLFAHQHTGFMVLDFWRTSGQAWLRVVEPVQGSPKGAWSSKGSASTVAGLMGR